MFHRHILANLQLIDDKFQFNVDLIKKIQALHAPNEDTDYTPRCDECNVGYPCDTIQIIDGLI